MRAIRCSFSSDAFQQHRAWLIATGRSFLYPLNRPLAASFMTASITLVGRCATPPAAVFYESGSVRVTFSMTITCRRFGASTETFHLELWGKTAQRAFDAVKTGALIGIIGDLRMHDGQPWVLVDRLEVLGAPCPDAAEMA